MKMNYWKALACLGALTFAVGCSTSSTDETTSTSQGRQSVVTLRGTNTDGMRSLPLAVSDVTVTVDGKEVSTSTEPHAMDLASTEEHRTATFVVPENSDKVSVTIVFDDFGGYETDHGEAGTLDARGTSVTLDVPARELAQNDRAVIALDLARSVANGEHGRRAFTPHAAITY